MSNSSWWPWANQKKEPLTPINAAHHPALQAKFLEFLDYVEPPNTFKPSEVAQMISEKDLQDMGYKHWREAIPGILALAWEKRELGDAVIVYKNCKVVPLDTLPEDLEGPIRIRRDAVLEDDW